MDPHGTPLLPEAYPAINQDFNRPAPADRSCTAPAISARAARPRSMKPIREVAPPAERHGSRHREALLRGWQASRPPTPGRPRGSDDHQTVNEELIDALDPQSSFPSATAADGGTHQELEPRHRGRRCHPPD